jgi:hypothetical protein
MTWAMLDDGKEIIFLMSTDMKTLMFLAFLISYGVTFGASYKLVAWYLRMKENSAIKTVVFQEMSILAGLISFFAPLYFLCGYWNTGLFALFLLAFQIPIALVPLLWAFMGSSQIDARLVGAWAGADLGVRAPLLMVGLMIAQLLGLLLYTAWCGVAYFTHVHSPEFTRSILQITLIMNILSGLIVFLQAAVFPLASRNIDEMGRLRVVLTQAAAAIPNLLYLALLISTFESGAQVFSIDPARATAVALSLPTLAAIGIYLIAFVLVPYAIGVHQARNWRLSLLKDVKDWNSEVISVLNVPEPDQYEPKLAKLGQDIAQSTRSFGESDEIVQMGKYFEEDAQQPPAQGEPRPPAFELLEHAYFACHKLDPRFIFIERGEALSKKINSAIADLAAQTEPENKIVRALKWSAAFEQDEKRIDTKIETEMKSRPAVAALLASAAAAVVTPLLSGVGTTLSQMLKGVLVGS